MTGGLKPRLIKQSKEDGPKKFDKWLEPVYVLRGKKEKHKKKTTTTRPHTDLEVFNITWIPCKFELIISSRKHGNGLKNAKNGADNARQHPSIQTCIM